VLPALTGQGYEHLTIQEGGAASREFLRATYGQVTAPDRRRVRQHLEEYCGLDTLGMVEIVGRLGGVLEE
jgi:Tfp pilus assembly protein PilP